MLVPCWLAPGKSSRVPPALSEPEDLVCPTTPLLGTSERPSVFGPFSNEWCPCGSEHVGRRGNSTNHGLGGKWLPGHSRTDPFFECIFLKGFRPISDLLEWIGINPGRRTIPYWNIESVFIAQRSSRWCNIAITPVEN